MTEEGERRQAVFLDFSGVCGQEDSEDISGSLPGDGWVKKMFDLTGMGGTEMYCSQEAEKALTDLCAQTGPGGIHFIDNGNYHYMSEIFMSRIRRPFSLLLLDNHTDMQRPAFEGLLSCGSWAGRALSENRCLRQAVLIGPSDEGLLDVDPAAGRSDLIRVRREEAADILAGRMNACLQGIKRDLPLYISVDKDVLDSRYVKTNWDQGIMSPEQLSALLRYFSEGRELIGADICGGLTREELFRLPGAQEQNRQIDCMLSQIIGEMISTS